MSIAIFTPGKPGTPAVAAVPAVNAKVTMELTPREATVVMGLIGVTSGFDGYPVYAALRKLASQGLIAEPDTAYIRAQREAASTVDTNKI